VVYLQEDDGEVEGEGELGRRQRRPGRRRPQLEEVRPEGDPWSQAPKVGVFFPYLFRSQSARVNFSASGIEIIGFYFSLSLALPFFGGLDVVDCPLGESFSLCSVPKCLASTCPMGTLTVMLFVLILFW
jgi:hypothetical protein